MVPKNLASPREEPEVPRPLHARSKCAWDIQFSLCDILIRLLLTLSYCAKDAADSVPFLMRKQYIRGALPKKFAWHKA